MIFYDEDAFFGSGEYEILTVSEVLEHLTKSEARTFEAFCRIAEKRRKRKELFSRGYAEARRITNDYEGKRHLKGYHSRCCTYDEYDYDIIGLDASMFY